MTEDRDQFLSKGSEKELVAASCAGDIAAWRELIGYHMPRLAAYIGARLRRPDVVDKIVLSTVRSAWQHLEEFGPSFGKTGDFGTWFRKEGARIALGWHKANATESINGVFPVERCPEGVDTTDDASPENMRRIEAALGNIAGGHRMILEHLFRGGLNSAEISDAMHKTEEECEELLVEALEALDRALDLQDTLS